MDRPVWQRERAWVGAEGVAEKIDRWARPHRPGRQVDSVEDLLSRPEWKGAGTLERNGWVYVKHPSGAIAKVRAVPLVANLCGRAKCTDAKTDRRCPKCERRTCDHRRMAGVCFDCRSPTCTESSHE